MRAPDPLCQRLATVPGLGPGLRRLVLLLPQIGDFDSLEYAQALVPALPRLEAAGIALLAIGIGAAAGADRFCAYTGFPRSSLQVDPEPTLHRALGLYAGLPQPCEVGRYHSLIAQPGSLPAELLVTATTDQHEIMGVRHRSLMVEGVQFHPESVLTPDGPALMGNFLRQSGGRRDA